MLIYFLAMKQMCPQSFEKDDDSNGHIDLITSASVSYIQFLFVIHWMQFSPGPSRNCCMIVCGHRPDLLLYAYSHNKWKYYHRKNYFNGSTLVLNCTSYLYFKCSKYLAHFKSAMCYITTCPSHSQCLASSFLLSWQSIWTHSPVWSLYLSAFCWRSPQHSVVCVLGIPCFLKRWCCLMPRGSTSRKIGT